MHGADRPYWSFSRLSAYSCPALGYYKYERRLDKKGDPFFALKAGQDGHEILHLIWTEDLTPAEAVDHVMLPASTGGGLFSQESDDITPTQMQEMMESYVKTVLAGPYRPVSLTPYMIDFSKLAYPTEDEVREALKLNGQLSEMGVACYWEGLVEPFGGIIDRLMENQDTGQIEVWDTKFTSSPLTEFLGSRWEGSYQMIGYAALWRELTGLNIDAGKVEAIYIGSSAKYNLGETRYYPVFDGWKDEMRDDLTYWINSRVAEIKWRKEVKLWPQVDGSWPSWRQKVCRGCDFKDLCFARPSARDGLIQRGFEERP